MFFRVGFAVIFFYTICCGQYGAALADPGQLSGLNRNAEIEGFRVANLYSDREGSIVGAKFWHIETGAPIYLLQIETAPQVYMWVDTPVQSGTGLPHSLEHLVSGKGIKGRYATLLTGMRLSISSAATTQDFNFYEFCSGTGMAGFYEQFHAWLDALYRSDFTDIEAEREFFHFGIATEATTKKKVLVEEGTVYNEQLTNQGIWTLYYELNKRALGENNPFGFDASGVPGEMRSVTSSQIRSFYQQHYHLGPNTGFIFVVSPKESVPDLLNKVSKEFKAFAALGVAGSHNPSAEDGPKYPIHSSNDIEPELYPFPAETNHSPGQIRFTWRPAKVDSFLELKLLQLFVRSLADGEQSLLYASLVDQKNRLAETGATSVYSDVFLANSPRFPVISVGLAGISGDQISRQQVESIRSLILKRLAEIAKYADHSPELISFNRLVAANAKSWSRSEDVWTRNAPLFGYLGSESKWKEHFEYLELDPSFVHSLTTEDVWRSVDELLSSGTNIWQKLIDKFGFLSTPYAAASVPSPKLLEITTGERQKRLKDKTADLMGRYHTSDPQEALSMFESSESIDLKDIQAIEARVPRPHFTENPPLTRDDDIRYRQMNIGGAEALVTVFEKPPTIDVGFSFDLHKVPEKYYKYFAIVPRSLDSLGLKHGDFVLSYSELLTQLQQTTYRFTAGFDSNALSKRAEFNIRLSGTNVQELRSSLVLLQRMVTWSNLEEENLSRLRDIIRRRVSTDDSYTKQEEANWISDPSTALRYENDTLFVALNSHFTQAHWNERLKWLFHERVSRAEVAQLGAFAHHTLIQVRTQSRAKIGEGLSHIRISSPVQRELIEYWEKNLYSFPESELVKGLLKLAAEVQQDLSRGPAQALLDLKHLRQLILTSTALRLDLTLDEASLQQVKPDLEKFIRTLPVEHPARVASIPHDSASSILTGLQRRYPAFRKSFPLYVVFPYQGASTGAVVFTAHSPGYASLDHKSLVQVLASKSFSGAGPQSFFMKTWEIGLAYNNGVFQNPGTELITYYADRSPDLTALVEFVGSVVANDDGPQKQTDLDYLMSQAFSIPRSMLTFSQRGLSLALDVRDGNPPEKIRKFSSALLRLRHESGLLSEVREARTTSIAGVLAGKSYFREQQSAQSTFFFVGPLEMLAGLEARALLPKLYYTWPTDYWMP